MNEFSNNLDFKIQNNKYLGFYNSNTPYRSYFEEYIGRFPCFFYIKSEHIHTLMLRIKVKISTYYII